MITKEIFDRVKLDARTHTITYVLMKYDMEGVELTEYQVKRIQGCKDYKEFGDERD